MQKTGKTLWIGNFIPFAARSLLSTKNANIAVKMVDYSDFNEWAKTQPNEVLLLVATRAALRSLPWTVDIRTGRATSHEALFLRCCRALSLSWLGFFRPVSTDDRIAIYQAGDAIKRSAGATRDSVAAIETITFLWLLDGGQPFRIIALNPVTNVTNAIESAYLAEDSQEFINEFEADVRDFKNGKQLSEVFKTPCWRHLPPDRNIDQWKKLKYFLSSRRTDWAIWTAFFDKIVYNQGDYDFNIEFEEIKLSMKVQDWKRGPKFINPILVREAEKFNITKNIDDFLTRTGGEDQPDIPAQRPAVIEVQEGDDGRLDRKAPEPPHLDDAAREHRLRAAWAAHDQALSALQALDPGRNEPGLTHALAAYREAMGATFDDLNVIALGAHGERLVGYTARIDDLLVGAGAAELAALVALHGLFVRQFEEWRQYIGDGRPDPTPEVAAAAAALARETKNFPNLFSGELIEVAVDLADAATLPLTADPGDRLPRALALGVVDSDINILSGLSTQVPRYLRDAGARARKGSLDGVENASRRATEAGLFFALGQIGTLITGLPGELSFLTGSIALLNSGGASSQGSETKEPEASPRETGDDDGEDDRV